MGLHAVDLVLSDNVPKLLWLVMLCGSEVSLRAYSAVTSTTRDPCDLRDRLLVARVVTTLRELTGS